MLKIRNSGTPFSIYVLKHSTFDVYRRFPCKSSAKKPPAPYTRDLDQATWFFTEDDAQDRCEPHEHVVRFTIGGK